MRPDHFEGLYEAHAQPLFGFLAYRTGDRALAEDLLADTFERALRGRTGFDRRKASERTWLYAIALNALRDHARRRATEGRAMERMSVPPPVEEDPFASVRDRDALGRALEVLTDEEQEAISLRFGADLSVPQIAQVLGVELTTAEGRVYRALRKLRAELSRSAEPLATTRSR